nr:DUF6629 family protein [Kitasatospora sp. SUK 42]
MHGHTLGYAIGVPHPAVLLAGYLLTTVGSLHISGDRLLRRLGLLAGAGAALCALLWHLAFISTLVRPRGPGQPPAPPLVRTPARARSGDRCRRRHRGPRSGSRPPPHPIPARRPRCPRGPGGGPSPATPAAGR